MVKGQRIYRENHGLLRLAAVVPRRIMSPLAVSLAVGAGDGMGRWVRRSREAIGDLVGHHHRDPLCACKMPQQRPELDQLGAPACHGRGTFAGAVLVELGTVVGGHRVDHDQAYVVLLDGHRKLVAQDVFLGFKIGGLDAQDTRERGFLGRRQRDEGRVGREQLCQAGGGQWSFGGDIDGGFGKTPWWRKLRGEQECQEQLRLTSTAGAVRTNSNRTGRVFVALPLAGHLDEITRADATRQGSIQLLIQRAYTGALVTAALGPARRGRERRRQK